MKTTWWVILIEMIVFAALFRKLSAGLEDLKKQGYLISYKVFPDMGHGGLIGENTERFIEEVDATHRKSLQKAVSLSEVGTE